MNYKCEVERIIGFATNWMRMEAGLDRDMGGVIRFDLSFFLVLFRQYNLIFYRVNLLLASIHLSF